MESKVKKMREAAIAALRVLNESVCTGLLQGDNAYDAIKKLEDAIALPLCNCDKAECDTVDHAASLFARETGNEMPEKPTGTAMMIRMNALCKWPPEEYKGGGSK